jgi:hypothetical protein
MKFNKRLLEPSYSRHADFNSLSSQESAYSFRCSRCSATVGFPFSEVIGKEYSWKQTYSKGEVDEIKSYFQMNVVGKSLDGGRPAILEVTCDSCRAEFMVYAGVNETSNSVYRVVVQSIAEVKRD